MPANPLATPECAIEVIGEMVAQHHKMLAVGQINIKPRVVPATFGCIAALNSHAHAMAEAALPLWNSPTAQAACLPLARAAFECGLVAQWLSRDAEALEAILAEFERQQRAVARDFAKVGYLEPLVEPMLATLLGRTSPKADTARSIEKISKLFDGGDEIYANYRVLCRFTHAGIPVVEQWLQASGTEAPYSFTLRAFREPEKAYVVFFGWALLFTASAYGDLIRSDKGYNNRLNRWAFRMGIDRRLRLAS